MRRAAEEKTNLERKLRNLEKLLLCGDNWVKGGRATDGINLAALDLAPAQDGATGGADWSGRSRNPAALTMRLVAYHNVVCCGLNVTACGCEAAAFRFLYLRLRV